MAPPSFAAASASKETESACISERELPGTAAATHFEWTSRRAWYTSECGPEAKRAEAEEGEEEVGGEEEEPFDDDDGEKPDFDERPDFDEKLEEDSTTGHALLTSEAYPQNSHPASISSQSPLRKI